MLLAATLVLSLRRLTAASTHVAPSIHFFDARFSAPCQSVYMPPNLCRNCRMLPFNSAGRFENQRFIYDLDDPTCRAGLAQYVSLNPCDHVRRAQMAGFRDESNRRRIGVFMYAVCETCCDCIPIGSRPGQYAARKAAGTLIRIIRGNCPVHLHFDVCRMWPNIKNIAPPGGATNLDRDLVCPLVKEWYDGPARAGWERNAAVRGIDWRVKRLLWQLKTHAKCEDETLWKECAALEVAQGMV